MAKKPSKALTFFLSMCTGVGHLYLGAMTRGIQFMVVFLGSIALVDYFPMRIFPFWIPIIWFYGLFDALQLADQENREDKPLVEWKFLSGKRWGYILIGLGLLLMVDVILPSIWYTFLDKLFMDWYNFRTLLIAVILIIVGIFLLRGKKVKKSA